MPVMIVEDDAQFLCLLKQVWCLNDRFEAWAERASYGFCLSYDNPLVLLHLIHSTVEIWVDKLPTNLWRYTVKVYIKV